ncbi:MAG: hypothetical protein ACTSWM_04845 [Alphaproteobacteria bacterium]
MEAYIDGALARPTQAGSTFTLIDEAGATVSTSSVTVTNGVATATIPAVDLPSTVGFGERYREQWALVMPDGETHIATREASVAKFRLYPPASDPDLLTEYPGLLSEFGTAISSFQGFIDEAWRHIIEKLWSHGTWPDLIVSTSQLRGPLRERAYYLIFKNLYRKSGGAPRWKDLMDEHKDNFGAAWGGMTFKVDLDNDGVADSDERRGAGTVVHRNTAPRRSRSRDPRW